MFKVLSDGEAYYEVSVITNSATKISVYMELQRKNGNSWTTVKTFSQTKNSKNALFSTSTKVNTSIQCRVYYKATVLEYTYNSIDVVIIETLDTNGVVSLEVVEEGDIDIYIR